MNNDNNSVRVLINAPLDAAEIEARSNAASRRSPPLRTPPIDIHEEADRLILEADLPGASEKTVSVQLQDNVLTIHAHVQSPVPEGAQTIHREYPEGDFFRSFILSDEIDNSGIRAEINQGVLRLELPKSPRLKTRRIEVKGPSSGG
jgi:HSP20 family protein